MLSLLPLFPSLPISSLEAEVSAVTSRYSGAVDRYRLNVAEPEFVDRHAKVLRQARAMERKSNEKRRLKDDEHVLVKRQQSGVVPLTDYCKLFWE